MKTSLLLYFLTASLSAFGGQDQHHQTTANNPPPPETTSLATTPQDATAQPPSVTPTPEPQQPGAQTHPAPVPRAIVPQVQAGAGTSPAAATPDQVIKYSYTIARWKHEGTEGWYERTNAHLTTLAGRPPAIPRMELPYEGKGSTALASTMPTPQQQAPVGATAESAEPNRAGPVAKSDLPPGHYEVGTDGVIRRVESAEPARADGRSADEPAYVIYPDGRLVPWGRAASHLRRGQSATSRSSGTPFHVRLQWPQVIAANEDYAMRRY